MTARGRQGEVFFFSSLRYNFRVRREEICATALTTNSSHDIDSKMALTGQITILTGFTWSGMTPELAEKSANRNKKKTPFRKSTGPQIKNRQYW